MGDGKVRVKTEEPHAMLGAGGGWSAMTIIEHVFELVKENLKFGQGDGCLPTCSNSYLIPGEFCLRISLKYNDLGCGVSGRV
jgi:hypothetical protein